MQYFLIESPDKDHLNFRKISVLEWWEKTDLVLIVHFLPPCPLSFLPSFFPSPLSCHANWWFVPPFQNHHIQLIRLFTAQGSWPRGKFEPEIPSMRHLPNKLELYLPRWVCLPNSQRSSLSSWQPWPPSSCHKAIQILPLRGKSATSHRSVSPQISTPRYRAIIITWSSYIERALSESLSTCLAETS